MDSSESFVPDSDEECLLDNFDPVDSFTTLLRQLSNTEAVDKKKTRAPSLSSGLEGPSSREWWKCDIDMSPIEPGDPEEVEVLGASPPPPEVPPQPQMELIHGSSDGDDDEDHMDSAADRFPERLATPSPVHDSHDDSDWIPESPQEVDLVYFPEYMHRTRRSGEVDGDEEVPTEDKNGLQVTKTFQPPSDWSELDELWCRLKGCLVTRE